MEFQVKILGGHGIANPLDDNIDIEVKMADGRRFVATFFTIQNIVTIMRRYEVTGECKNGLYFWASDMVILRELTEHSIRATVQDLVDSGEFAAAFSESSERDGD